MNVDVLSEPAAAPLQAAVEEVDIAVQHLIKMVDDGALTDLGASGLVGFLQRWDKVRNRMPVIDRAAIQYGTEQGVPAALTERSMTQVLVTGLRLSPGEARRRVKAAEHLADRRSMVGEPLPPIRPHLAAAQREGLVGLEQVSLVDDALRKLAHSDPGEVDAGEEFLVEAAKTLPVKELGLVAQKLVDAIDPDGPRPADEAELARRRFLHLKQRQDGSWAGDFRLTPDLGQKLKDLLDPLMKPATTAHPTDGSGGNGGPGRKHVEIDERTQGQRRHDALGAIIDRMLRRDDAPDSGGTPATLIITIRWDDFLARCGIAHYSDGTPVSVQTALGLADQAEIAWCFQDVKGAVLDLFRSRRIASKDQTIALYARDGGCSFPGCTVEPQWCERHHILPWWTGGMTNLNNLTLVCRYHHRHFEQRGWSCRLNDDKLPVWIPPKWVDRDQKPLLNPRIPITHWNPQEPLDL